VFLNTTPVVIASIAGSVSWLLTQWKKLEEIRKIRADAAKLGQFDQSELEDFFDKKITERLDDAINTKVEELIGAGKLSAPRKAELDSELAWALKALFARVERGMRIEVAIEKLDPKDEPNEMETAANAMLDKIGELSGELSFPRLEAEPILALPRSTE
jgi:hypothetical protein